MTLIRTPAKRVTSDFELQRESVKISFRAHQVRCDWWRYKPLWLCAISIHAPRAGCDFRRPTQKRRRSNISIHAPRVGCDKIREGENPKRRKISIHAPRVGCDLKQQHPTRLRTNNLNPRTPGGVRPSTTKPRLFARSIFQSTHPGWGATSSLRPPSAVKVKFQSTHPGWGATLDHFQAGVLVGFQSTHPRWGAT